MRAHLLMYIHAYTACYAYMYAHVIDGMYISECICPCTGVYIYMIIYMYIQGCWFICLSVCLFVRLSVCPQVGVYV